MKRISEFDVGLGTYTEDPKELLRMAVDSMADSRQQPKLENWTLFSFCQVYNRGRSEKFEWAERGEAPQPDYLVFTQQDSIPTALEVTELLDPGRKRREEYKSAWERAKQTGDYLVASDVPEPSASHEQDLIARAREGLARKFSKPYPNGTWLVVYFNPTLFTALHEDTLTFAVRVVQAAIDSLEPPERIAQVWVLTNDLRISRLRTIR